MTLKDKINQNKILKILAVLSPKSIDAIGRNYKSLENYKNELLSLKNADIKIFKNDNSLDENFTYIAKIISDDITDILTDTHLTKIWNEYNYCIEDVLKYAEQNNWLSPNIDKNSLLAEYISQDPLEKIWNSIKNYKGDFLLTNYLHNIFSENHIRSEIYNSPLYKKENFKPLLSKEEEKIIKNIRSFIIKHNPQLSKTASNRLFINIKAEKLPKNNIHNLENLSWIEMIAKEINMSKEDLLFIIDKSLKFSPINISIDDTENNLINTVAYDKKETTTYSSKNILTNIIKAINVSEPRYKEECYLILNNIILSQINIYDIKDEKKKIAKIQISDMLKENEKLWWEYLLKFLYICYLSDVVYEGEKINLPNNEIDNKFPSSIARITQNGLKIKPTNSSIIDYLKLTTGKGIGNKKLVSLLEQIKIIMAEAMNIRYV